MELVSGRQRQLYRCQRAGGGALFSDPGTYELQLTADDGELSGSTVIIVHAVAAGSDITELSPDADTYVRGGIHAAKFQYRVELAGPFSIMPIIRATPSSVSIWQVCRRRPSRPG